MPSKSNKASVHRSKRHYGDLRKLNTSRVILDAVGAETLEEIAADIVDMLGTSVAIYEANGDYALGIYSSKWCRRLDAASRELCDTDDDAQALSCGKWLCHESCWNKAARPAIRTGEPVDVPCAGGLRLCALPIRAGETIVGAISFGYGAPPRTPGRLRRISEKYRVDEQELRRIADDCAPCDEETIRRYKRRGQILAKLIGDVVDLVITERRTAEKKLLESRERFQELFENMTAGVAVWEAVDDGADFVLVDMNRRGAELTDRTRDSVVGKRATEAFPGIVEMGLLAALGEVWRTGRGMHFPTTYYEDSTAVGWFENRLYRLPNGHVVAIYDNVTERRALEEQLRQAQKMEVVGQLAGGVAHDFRNQLTVIRGYAEMLLRDSPDPEDRERLETILTAVQRSADLTGQLLAFSRKQMLRPQVVDLVALLNDIGNTLRRLIGEDIQLALVAHRPQVYAYLDASQLQHAVINLATNARDAMPDGGQMTIECTCAALDAETVSRMGLAEPGNYARITVTDTGSGMDEQTRSQIFEPFFTTKDVNKGTGLGLSMVYGFARQSGGDVTCRSAPGRGTTFELYFRCVGREPREPGRLQTSGRLPGGSETVLVVEDEPLVLTMVAGALRNAGYNVLTASDPRVALSASDAAQGIDLLLTDIIMPTMGGIALADRVKARHPGVDVLYMSGYAGDALSKRGIDPSHIHLLTKPIAHTDLLNTVRRLLDEHG